LLLLDKMSSIALQSLLEETLSFLKTLADVVAGDDPIADDAEQVKQRKGILEDKFRRFMSDFKDNKSKPPTKDQLARLDTLRKQIARKDAALDALYKQLRDFELEVSLRSGGARKRALEKASGEDAAKILRRMQGS
jgi:hypothetical protein